MLSVPVPYTKNKREAEEERMPYRADYAWKHNETGYEGIRTAFVWKKVDAQRLVDYWNRKAASLGAWEYTLIAVVPILHLAYQ